MHNLMKIFLCVVLFSSLVCAQAEKKISFKAVEHDFGTLKQLTPAEFIFEYTNVSSDTVYLDNPKASCGCTAALMSEDVLPPGKSGSVKVKFTPPVGFHGTVTKTITMYTRPDAKVIEVLRIRANVVGDLEATPSMVRFNATTGATQTERIRLKSTADRPISLDNISASLMEYRDTTAGDQYHSDRVIAKPFTGFTFATTKKELQPGEDCELVLNVMPEEKGQINGSIRIVTGKYETILSIAGVIMRKKVITTTNAH